MVSRAPGAPGTDAADRRGAPGTDAADRRELARHAVARFATGPGVTGAFLAGSLTVGLGNRTSDVDAYLVGPGLAAGRRQVFAGPVRVDLHRLDRAGLEAAAERIVGATSRSDDGTAGPPERDVMTAVLLARGEVLVDDDGTLVACRQLLTRHADRLRRLMTGHWLTAAHYHLEDLAGLAGPGHATTPDDAEAAVMVGRRLLHAAGKAVAAACDDLYPGDKWVWHQLRRAAPDGFPHAEFRRLLRADPWAVDGGAAPAPGDGRAPARTGPGAGRAPARTGLDGIQALAQTCLAVAATLGWHGVPLSRWPAWLGGEGPLRRAPGLSVRAYDDGVLVTTPDGHRFRLRPEVALVWALCDGTTPGALRRAAAELRDAHPAYAGLGGERTDRILDRLTRAGLATGPATGVPTGVAR